MKTLKIKDKIWIQEKGRIYAISASPKARGSTEEEQDLSAPFSCKVLKVQAQLGAKVKKGDPIVVVEAMKMEYAYFSPKEGTIQEVLIKEGDILVAGAKFIRWVE